MKARVTITLKAGVLDPQGQAIVQALHGMGYDEVSGARQGKVVELELEGEDRAVAEARVREMCERLLANTVIERYEAEILG